MDKQADQNSDQTLLLTRRKALENYSDIILTDDEIDQALLLGRIAKDRKLRAAEALKTTRAYWKKVNSVASKLAMPTAEQQLGILIAKAGIDYIIDDDNRGVINALCLYFTNDPAFELLRKGYSLNKGILLWGPLGCGKTSLMQMFQDNYKRRFSLVSVTHVATEYEKSGAFCMDLYMGDAYMTGHGWCFDDLGVEEVSVNFGNKRDVLGSILSQRYARKPQDATHITTNLGVDEIESLYGSRLRDRFKENFNVINFATTVKSRR